MNIDCPFGCGANLKISEIESHSKTACPKSVTHCMHQELGCDWIGPFKEQSAHTATCPFEKVLPIIRKYRVKYERLRAERSEVIKVIKEQQKTISELQEENLALTMALKKVKESSLNQSIASNSHNDSPSPANEETIVYNTSSRAHSTTVDASEKKEESNMPKQQMVITNLDLGEVSSIMGERNELLGENDPTSHRSKSREGDSLSDSNIVFDTTIEIMNELVKYPKLPENKDKSSSKQETNGNIYIDEEGSVYGLNNSPQSKVEKTLCVYTAFDDGSIYRFDNCVGSGEMIHSSTEPMHCMIYHTTNSGAKYVCTGGFNGDVKLFVHDDYDPAIHSKKQKTQTQFHCDLKGGGERIVRALCSHRGLLASAVKSHQRNTIEIWDADTNERNQRLEGHSNLISTLASNGDQLFSGGLDEAIFMWDITRPTKPLREFQTNTPISCMIWDEKSKCLFASYNSFKDIEAWDLRVAKCVRRFMGHTAPVTSLCSHVGHICSGSEDGTVRIWDTLHNSQSLNVLHLGLGAKVNSVSTVSLHGSRMEKAICSSLSNKQVLVHQNAFLPRSDVCMAKFECEATPLFSI